MPAAGAGRARADGHLIAAHAQARLRSGRAERRRGHGHGDAATEALHQAGIWLRVQVATDGERGNNIITPMQVACPSAQPKVNEHIDDALKRGVRPMRELGRVTR